MSKLRFSGQNRFVLYFFLPVVAAILGGAVLSAVTVSGFSKQQREANDQQVRDARILAGSMALGMEILQVQKDLNTMAQAVRLGTLKGEALKQQHDALVEKLTEMYVKVKELSTKLNEPLAA